jgi:hypothetical protein
MKKNTMKNLALLLAVILAFSACASTKIVKDPNAKFLGEWEYVVEEIPVDVDGIMTISNIEGVLHGSLSNSMGEMEISEFSIEDGLLKASFDADGNFVELGGAFDGDSYTGTLTVQDTDFPMKAKKKVQ